MTKFFTVQRPLMTEPPGDGGGGSPFPRGGLRCGFCGCTNTPSSDVLKMSDEAKRMSKQAEQLEKLTEEREALKARVQTLTEEIADLKKPKPAATDDDDL